MRNASYALLILVTCLAVSVSCGSDENAEPLSVAAVQEQVEAELPRLAQEFSGGVPPDDVIFALLEAYLSANPDFFGATFAVEPGLTDASPGRAPYVFRRNGALERKDLAAVDGYDYTEQEWYASPEATGMPRWSDEYFDAGGGDVNMITFSIPVYLGDVAGPFIGILTTDIATDGRPTD